MARKPKIPKAPKVPVKKEFQISPDVEEVANEVIRKENLDFGQAKIAYLLVYPNISKTVAGRCIRTGQELKYFSDKDYLVELSGELWDALDGDTKYNLMHHELLHIYLKNDEKSGDVKYEIRKHDIEDFEVILKRHGIDWAKKIKLEICSIYDLSPSAEDSIVI